MSELLVDLMPPEARRIPALRRRMRLMRLASVLVGVLVVGVVTDSIAATEAVKQANKVRRITIAPLLAEAMRRTAEETSVSSLFD